MGLPAAGFTVEQAAVRATVAEQVRAVAADRMAEAEGVEESAPGASVQEEAEVGAARITESRRI